MTDELLKNVLLNQLVMMAALRHISIEVTGVDSPVLLQQMDHTKEMIDLADWPKAHK